MAKPTGTGRVGYRRKRPDDYGKQYGFHGVTMVIFTGTDNRWRILQARLKRKRRKSNGFHQLQPM